MTQHNAWLCEEFDKPSDLTYDRNFFIGLANVIFVRSQRKVKSREKQWPFHLLHCFVANGLRNRDVSLGGGPSLMRPSTALFTKYSSNIRSSRGEGVKALLRHRGGQIYTSLWGHSANNWTFQEHKKERRFFAIFSTLRAWDDTTTILLPPYRSLACFQLHSRRPHLSL